MFLINFSIKSFLRGLFSYIYGFSLLHFALCLSEVLFNYVIFCSTICIAFLHASGYVIQFFGLGSFWIVFILCMGGIRAIFTRKICVSVFTLLLLIISTASLCLFIALIFEDAGTRGGYVGEAIKDCMRSYCGVLPCIVIALASIIITCCLALLLRYCSLRFKRTKPTITTNKTIKKPKPKKSTHTRLPKKNIKYDKKLNSKDIDIVHNFPSLGILGVSSQNFKKVSNYLSQNNTKLLLKTLADFGIQGHVLNVKPGPVITLYELELAAGIKSSRVIGLVDDIARSMSAISARIAIIPGRNAMGIELPNKNRETVFLRDLLNSQDYNNSNVKIPLALGKTISGDAVIADLTDMPHLLVAGTTGSGKSVAINAMILSILYKLTPDQCKLILIDPKMLELSIYEGIPHLITPVVTEAKDAVVALKWVVREMEARYSKMSELGVRNITGYNIKIQNDLKTHSPAKTTSIPFIVVVVDEMADLMLVAGKEIEVSIQRLAQMARAAGIHIITATQRPSVDVITGVIKANFPTRMSFAVTSRIDSRTILGEHGAERLLGMGDMLYMSGGSKIIRLHGPFVADTEVQQVVAFLKTQGQPDYQDEIIFDEESSDEDGGNAEDKDLYSQAIKIILQSQKVSISYVQRKLRIGYNRSANLVERMEKEGIVSSPNHSGKRSILIDEYPK